MTKEELLKINELALRYFRYKYNTTSSVRRYLLEKRKLPYERGILEFELGYCGSLKELQGETDLSEREVYEAGLGQFEHRIMFPLYDEFNILVGFGGRLGVGIEGMSKYINSPSTILYDKSRFLYGLNKSKKHIVQEKFCYLVEGYMDMIRMYIDKEFQYYTLRNVVACSGTSFTLKQAQILTQYCNKIKISFDDDDPGHRATLRAIEICLQVGLEPEICIFPPDPDSYLSSTLPKPAKGTNSPVKFLFIEIQDEEDRIRYIVRWIKGCIKKEQANKLLENFYQKSSKQTRKAIQTLFNKE